MPAKRGRKPTQAAPPDPCYDLALKNYQWNSNAMVGRGGRREGAGRKPGIPNRITADIKVAAQSYGPAAITELARLAGLTAGPGAFAEAARIAALKELLDRGYGRATLPLAADAEMPAVIEFRWAPAEETIEAPRPALTIDAGDADADDAGEPLRVVWSSD
jgi:hypothetical protein